MFWLENFVLICFSCRNRGITLCDTLDCRQPSQSFRRWQLLIVVYLHPPSLLRAINTRSNSDSLLSSRRNLAIDLYHLPEGILLSKKRRIYEICKHFPQRNENPSSPTVSSYWLYEELIMEGQWLFVAMDAHFVE